MQLLKNNQMQFVCLQYCVSPHFVVQRNNLFSLVQFSSLIYKRRGKTLISKANKHKLNNSSKIQIAFFILKTFKFFLENYLFCRKSGNDVNSKGLGLYIISVIMTQCLRKSICDSPLNLSFHNNHV